MRFMSGCLHAPTDRARDALAKLLDGFNRKTIIVETPPDILHFKSDCGLIGDATVLSTAALYETAYSTSWRRSSGSGRRRSGGECVARKRRCFHRRPFPKTAALLERRGYNVVRLPISEIAKIDAGLSACRSGGWKAVDRACNAHHALRMNDAVKRTARKESPMASGNAGPCPRAL